VNFIPLIARILFGIIFLRTAKHLFSAKELAGYISGAQRAGVPFPEVLAPFASAIAPLGALLILLGYRAKFGGWLIIVFLAPVTLYMHRFMDIHFMYNLSMMGGALMFAYHGSGPLSLDQWLSKRTNMGSGTS
jgi:putative oxidoreductase